MAGIEVDWSALPQVNLPPGRSVLMLGTDTATRGGIAAVIKTYQDSGLFDHVRVTNVPTHQDGSGWRKATRFLSALATSCNMIVCGRVALVHAHVSSGASFWRKSVLLAIARACRQPTVFHLHSGGFAAWCNEPGLVPAIRRAWIRRTLLRSDAVIVLTPHWQRWLEEFAQGTRSLVVSNPVHIPPWSDLRTQPRPDREIGRVLFLGWIYDFKGIYDLLQAWVLFRKRNPGWKLVVGGKGEVDRFLREAERAGVTTELEFLGWVTGMDKERQLQLADIFVLPSYREGMPVSILEAMANGVAVATTAVGGVPDMMEEGVHGVWMKPGDVRGIASAIERLARDPSLRARLSRAAYEHVQRNYSIESSLRPLLDLYTELIGGSVPLPLEP